MVESPRPLGILCACAVLSVLFLLPAAVSAVYDSWTYTPGSDVSGVTMTPDGSTVLVGGGRIHVLNPDGTILWKKWFGDHISISANSNTVICTFGSQIYRYTGDGKFCWDIAVESKPRDVVVTPDGSRIIVGDATGTVSFIDAAGEIIREFVTDKGTDIRDVAISGNGNTIGVISPAGTWCFSKYGNMRWKKDDRIQGDGGQCLALSRDGGEIAAGCGEILRYLNTSGGVVWKHDCVRSITAVAISGTGEYVTAATQSNMLLFFTADGTLQWDFNLGKSSEGGEITGPGIRDLCPDRIEDGWVQDIAISEDGEWILTGSTNKMVRLFSNDGSLVWSERADNPVDYVALTEDGSLGIAATESQVISVVRRPDPEPTPAPVPPDVAPPVIPVVPSPPPEDPDILPPPVVAASPEPHSPAEMLREFLSGVGTDNDVLRMIPILMTIPFR